MIQRTEYLNWLQFWREKQVIKVLTGIRRSGKSTLFQLYMEELRKEGVAEEQMISINLEDLAYEELTDYKKLYQYVSERLCKDKWTYVFLDEIQQCKNFEKAVDSLFIKQNVDVYITGSNAYMLSGELATLLSGRYVELQILPFSFVEYYESIKNIELDTQRAFQQYMMTGSFPYIAVLLGIDAKAGIEDYLSGIYHTVLIKDVAKREGITDISILEDVIKCLASSIGSPVSIKKISDTIVSYGRKIATNTVDNYVRALMDSFLFYKVNRYDVRGKQHLKTLGKYYLVDTGLKGLLSSNKTGDIGHMLENIVFLELLRRKYQVSIGKIADVEIDFVATKGNEVCYIQVSNTVLDENTLKRELTPLQKVKDNYPKILLTLDTIGAGNNYEGIKQINVIDWLLGKEKDVY